ncbi:MAG: phage virion morphogenesis protein [Muribaculaceae bacterium]|nr:phage virion morphogenesis protein [Duncaniella muris]
MDIKDFAKFMEAKRGEFETLMRRTMPVSVGRVAKDHFDDSFRKGGFLNGGFHPWKPARRLSSGGSSAASKYGTLLSGRKRLSQATNYVAGSYRVKVANKTHYAPVHNWGATIPRTDAMRAHAWKMFFKTCNVAKNEPKDSKRKKTSDAALSSNPEARFWKAMALTKKRSIKIPQRQFLGESQELTENIHSRFENEIRKILNS